MLRFLVRDLVYLLAIGAIAVAWWFDRSKLANDLKNCRFAVEHQRETIQSLSGQEKSDE